MPPPREKTHEERAAALLQRVRAASGRPTKRKETQRSDGDEVLEMPRLIHALHTMGGQSVVDAMHTVRRLAQGNCTTRARLSRVSAPELEELGIGTASSRDKLVQVLHTLGSASADTEYVGLTAEERAGHQKKRQRNEAVRRDWGDAPQTPTEEPKDFLFHPVTDEKTLRGRHVVVNRAPVMTAWCVVVLQYMGFTTPEALSIAQNYVGRTAHARAVSIGRAAPGGEKPSVSQNQPHITFMGVTIPVICLRSGTYRALHNGEIVEPERAFTYLRKSMLQMLPEVMGAMMLLASSYMDHTWATKDTQADHSADTLEKEAYRLYTEFRPETHGEWGKRATLYLDKILDLRRDSVPFAWPKDEEGMPHETSEVKQEAHAADAGHADPSSSDTQPPRPVKAEAASPPQAPVKTVAASPPQAPVKTEASPSAHASSPPEASSSHHIKAEPET